MSLNKKPRNQQFRKRQPQSSSSGSEDDVTFGIEASQSRSKPSRGLQQSSSGVAKRIERKHSSSSDEDYLISDDVSGIGHSYKSTRSGKSVAPDDMGATSIQEIDTQRDRDPQAIRDRALKSHRAGNNAKSFPYYIGHGHADDAGKQRYGPQRAPQNIRATTRWDYAPDICKDYKETGSCGFGDSCKFLHDRSDHKFGWQLDAEYEKGILESGYDYEMDDDEPAREEFPDTCNVCRESFRDPVKTKCEHYFCEKCFKTAVSKKNKCPICAQPIDGSVSVAKDLVAYLQNRGGSQIAVN